MIASSRKGEYYSEILERKNTLGACGYRVYSDFGKASGNDSKFQERRYLFLVSKKEKYSKCLRCTGCTVILVEPREIIPSSRKGKNYNKILERKNTLSALGVLSVQ